jgi:Flp pilus assembly protein TadG
MTNRKLQHGGFVMVHRGGEAGQAAVELALLMPFLALLLIGAVELARVAYAAIEVSNAAKAAVQYGAQSRATAGDTQGMLAAAQNDAYNLTGLTLTVGPLFCICSDGTASTCQSTDCATSHIEQTLTVTTHATFDPLIHFPGVSKTFTLGGYAAQKVLQ